MEISLRIKDDPEAGLLLDQFLDVCFDCVPLPDWAPAPTPVVTFNAQANAVRISAALAQLNAYLKEHSILMEEIHPPRDIGLNDWAEAITMQVLTNSSF